MVLLLEAGGREEAIPVASNRHSGSGTHAPDKCGEVNAMLYGRVATIEGRPDKIEKGVSRFRDQAIPLIQSAEGFEGALMLVDRENGRAVGITIWDSVEHREATDAAMAAIRTGAGDAMGGVPEVKLYDVPIYIKE